MNAVKWLLIFVLQIQCIDLAAQYTILDTLRGTITPERAWWDLKHYHLDIDVQPDDSTITGQNVITYEVLESSQVIQVDLQVLCSSNQVIAFDRGGKPFGFHFLSNTLGGHTCQACGAYHGTG